jgi:hypothetical protein
MGIENKPVYPRKNQVTQLRGNNACTIRGTLTLATIRLCVALSNLQPVAVQRAVNYNGRNSGKVSRRPWHTGRLHRCAGWPYTCSYQWQQLCNSDAAMVRWGGRRREDARRGLEVKGKWRLLRRERPLTTATACASTR